MYDKTLIVDILDQIIDAIETIQERCTFSQCKKYETLSPITILT